MGSLAAAPSHYLRQYEYGFKLSFLSQSKRSNRKLSLLFSHLSLTRKLGLPNSVINKVRGQTLSLSYGRLFAEFLNEESLVHLGLLDLSTCVGLRYGWHETRVR
jgi:hypothetical protein